MQKFLLTTLCLSAALTIGATAPVFNKAIKPTQAQKTGVSLFESFENAELTNFNSEESQTWLPENWTRESKTQSEPATINKWFRYAQASTYYPAPTDGSNFMMLLPIGKTEQDEWLISPSVKIQEGEILSFHALLSPLYFFKTGREYQDENNGYEWIEQVIRQRFRVMIKEGDNDWTVLYDFAEALMGKTVKEITELEEEMSAALKEYSFPLDAYAGKEIRIGFQYLGSEGNSMFLDEVRVGLPEMTTSYIPNFCTQYYGTVSNALPQAAPEPIALMPPFAPLYWMNLSDYVEDASYTWTYANPEGEGTLTTDEDELMDVYYSPRYNEEGLFISRDNWYDNPTLTAEAPGYAGSSFTAPGKFQVGGRGEAQVGGETMQFGLMPLSPAQYGLNFASLIREDEFGTFPIFGYGAGTDKFWTDYTFNGQNEEGEYAHLTAIMNFMYPAASPLVVSGGWVNAYGKVNPDAEFTYEIYPMVEVEDGYVPADKPMAAATCKGEDFLISDEGIFAYFTIPFKFATPVLIDETYPSYIVKLSGFRSPEVTYFAPMQTWKPAMVGYGFLEKEISFNGNVGTSLSSIANIPNEYGDMAGAFALNLDGCYPWLECDTEEIDLGAGTTADVNMESYYNAEQLTVECSSWINASVSGQGNKCKLSVSAAEYDSDIRAGFVKVYAPGVSKEFTVVQKKSSIEDIITDNGNATVVAVYTLSGAQVSTDNLAPGIYIARYSDGSARKLYVK